jgi:hypothetical protein
VTCNHVTDDVGFACHFFVQLVVCHGFSMDIEVFITFSSPPFCALCNICIELSMDWNGWFWSNKCFAYSDLTPFYV